MMTRLLALLLFALPLAAQTVNHGGFEGGNPVATVSWTNPQVAGDTIIAGVSPAGGVLTDTAGDTFTSDCVNGKLAIFRASNVASSAANTLTYTGPSGTANIVLYANEQTGNFKLDSCGNGLGTGTVPVTPATQTATGDFVYAFLNSAQGSSGTTVSVGMTFLTGQADTFWGPNIYSGWNIDAIGTPATQGMTFTYAPGLGGGSGTAIMAAYETSAPSPPLTLNIATKIVTCVKCDRTDDTPAQGSLVFQQGSLSNAFTFAADGSIAINASINMQFDPVTFSVLLVNATGQQVNGSGWQWSVPRANLSAGIATLGTLSFGGLAFKINSDGSVSFAGFLPVSQ